MRDLNPRPLGCKPRTLTAELIARNDVVKSSLPVPFTYGYIKPTNFLVTGHRGFEPL